MAIEPTLNLTTQTTPIEEIEFPKRDQRVLAWRDILDGFGKWRIWLMLAYHDIKLRYRRSVLGPFWLTLSMAITVYSMGYLYGHLFRSDIINYFPFVVGGMLAWSFISTVLIDLTETFSNGVDNIIKQIKMPYSLYVHRVVARNLIIFFHNVFVMLPVYLFFSQAAKIDYYTLLLIPNLIFIYLTAFSFGLIFAMLGSRYRDISQMIKSLVQVIFFVTPIMWSPNLLPANKMFLVLLNPVYSFIQLIRAPLLGQVPTFTNYFIALSVMGAGMFIAFKLFTRCRARIIYWI